MKRVAILIALCASTSVYGAVVQPVGASPQILIPAAGSAAGANGTFFRSDVSLVNLANHDQLIVLQWLPQAGTGSNSTATVTLPALTGLRSADFVSQYLHQTGLGAVLITGATAAGNVDTTARLFVNARIWSAQPGGPGTVSQTFPAIPVSAVNTPSAALFAVGGADNAANYRVNAGIVNLDPVNAQTFFISMPSSPIPEPVGRTITIPPMSMQQVSLGSGLPPTTQFSIQNITPTAARSNAWTAYSSTIDNVTGDSWSELAVSR